MIQCQACNVRYHNVFQNMMKKKTGTVQTIHVRRTNTSKHIEELNYVHSILLLSAGVVLYIQVIITNEILTAATA